VREEEGGRLLEVEEEEEEEVCAGCGVLEKCGRVEGSGLTSRDGKSTGRRGGEDPRCQIQGQIQGQVRGERVQVLIDGGLSSVTNAAGWEVIGCAVERERVGGAAPNSTMLLDGAVM
jgi:hypothetical protein